MAKRIAIRRDTLVNWNSVNPTLRQGELGLDLTNNRLKIGDGSTPWNTLDYFGTYESEFGNVTSGDGILNIMGGTDAVLGSGVLITVDLASSTVTGALSSTDWNIFNNKYTALPDQTGHAGEFLMTNGVSESWQEAPSAASGSLDRSYVVAMSVALG